MIPKEKYVCVNACIYTHMHTFLHTYISMYLFYSISVCLSLRAILKISVMAYDFIGFKEIEVEEW